MGEDAAGRSVDGNSTVHKAGIASVGRSGWLIVLVGRHRVAARGDEGWDLSSGTCCGRRPVLRHRTVVLLLVALVVELGHVLRGVRRVHARRLGSCCGAVGVRVDVLTASGVHARSHVGCHGDVAVLGAVVGHHVGLGLGGVWLGGHVHALEAMSKCSHVGRRVVHAVSSRGLGTAVVLVVVHVATTAEAVVGSVVAVLALVVVVRDRSHLFVEVSANALSDLRARRRYGVFMKVRGWRPALLCCKTRGNVEGKRPYACLAENSLGRKRGGILLMVRCVSKRVMVQRVVEGRVCQWSQRMKSRGEGRALS